MAWREPLARAGAALLAIASPASAQQIVGDWHGELAIGAGGLPIEVSVIAGADGKLSGSWRSPEQRSEPLAIGNVTFAGSSLSFDVPGDVASFHASWDATRKAWAGTWSQVTAVPLVLLPGKLPAASRP